MSSLTYNDRIVLATIEAHYRDFYQPPTIRYLCNATGITSTSHVGKILRKLEAEGLIRIVNRKPVPMRIIKKASEITWINAL